MDKRLVFGFTGILVMSAILFFAVASTITNLPSNDVSDGIQYHSNVCTGVIRADGTSYDNGCSHNLLTNAGKELIENYLGAGAGGAVINIALCNATAGCSGTDAADTSLDNEYAAGGLTRAAGTYASLGTGNWSVYKTFTATSDNLLTNQTGLFNSTSGATLFAENTFTLVTLQTNDQLTINWTIWVS